MHSLEEENVVARKTLRNEFVSVSVDERGRIVSLKNRATGTELISHPRAAEAWRMIIPAGRHTIDIIEGSRQAPPRVELVAGDGFHSIIISYDKVVGSHTWPVEARFVLSLADGSREVSARVEIVNQSEASIDEVEFPVLGGIGELAARGGRRVMNLVAAGDRGSFYADVLRRGLPDTGEESNHYVRRLETAMFESDRVGGVWLDLWSEREGLLVALCSKGPEFAFKVEKSPKEVPNAPAHRYPPGTSRWLRVWALHVPRIRPGTRWVSEPVIVMPHEEDWHGGADRYSAYRHERLRLAEPPAWMADFVGWTEILGKTYLGEVFHDYGQCAQAVARDGRVTGLDLVFYYGHSKLGAEGADFDHSPAPDLGGSEGFHAMVEGLHRSGVRVMLLDHFHRWINRDLPEFESMGLSRYAVLDSEGRPVTARWWKETFLSCRRLEGPTPVWVEMCPSCEEWLHLYLDHVTEMIELGVDGLELDTFCPSACHNPAHNHPRGADMSGAKIEFMRAVRAHARRLNPDFVLIGETMAPEAREVLDGY